jgi:ketosteroid isomerase-like protein
MEVAPMKQILLLAAIIIAGCTQQQSDQLTQQQQDQIKKEIKVVSDSIIARLERLDTTWLDYYADSPDWVMFGADGSQWDYQTTKNAQAIFASVASYKWTTTYEHFVIVTKDVVIAASQNKDEMTMKSGEKITYDPHAYTLVFKRIDGTWKVVYSHDSGTPVMQKAGKK